MVDYNQLALDVGNALDKEDVENLEQYYKSNDSDTARYFYRELMYCLRYSDQILNKTKNVDDLPTITKKIDVCCVNENYKKAEHYVILALLRYRDNKNITIKNLKKLEEVSDLWMKKIDKMIADAIIFFRTNGIMDRKNRD
jgi:hypothetical protein